jgi:aminopeptidase N
MTDRMAALATLAQHEVPERGEALDDFYKRYADNALVIDKWFSLQAASPHKSALDKVRGLTAHPAFSMGNPNRVRAVIGAFAQGNLTQFNRADGAGYAFVADSILAIDPKNPQLAARLATSFRTWRTLESGRRALAETQLRRIKASPNLSRDLADIVERALG